MAIYQKMFVVSLILGCCLWGQVHAEMSREAQQNLLDVLSDLGKDMDDVKGTPTPAYRLDLPKKYVAFYVVELRRDFLITSAGPKTGEHMLLLQLKLPSPVKIMDKMAAKAKKTCAKYYVLTPVGEMMCKDSQGNIVAYDLAPYTFDELVANNPNYTIERFIEEHKALFRKEWADRRKGLEQEKAANATEQPETKLRGPKASKRFSRAVSGSFSVSPINPVKPVSVALGDTAALKYVHIVYMPLASDSEEEEHSQQTKLCSVVKGCSMVGDVGVISSQSITDDPKSGDSFFPLEVATGAKSILGDKEVVFQVDIEGSNGDKADVYFEVVYESKLEKRRKEYRSWSNYYYYKYVEISYSTTVNRYPRYNQYKRSNGCYIGCVPVSWAILFGGYDQYRSYNLYRSGYDGTFGGSLKAPMKNDARVNWYLYRLNRILLTSCGSTTRSHYSRVSGFFKARHTYGNPRIITKYYTFETLHFDDVRNWVKSLIRGRWPAILSIKVNGGKGHAAVALGYRTKRRQYRTCFLFICGSWHYQYYSQLWLNMGWGGSSNGWYNTYPYRAWAAVW